MFRNGTAHGRTERAVALSPKYDNNQYSVRPNGHSREINPIFGVYHESSLAFVSVALLS